MIDKNSINDYLSLELTYKEACEKVRKIKGETLNTLIDKTVNENQSIFDCRKDQDTNNRIKKIIVSMNIKLLRRVMLNKKSKFIIIDGASCNGKSYIGEEISKKFKNIVVLDVDDLAKEEFDKKYEKIDIWKEFFEKYPKLRNKSKEELQKSIDNYINNTFDELVTENIEERVKLIAKNKKSCILVISSENVLTRILLFRYLGKYFEENISIYVISKDINTFKYLLTKRFGNLDKNNDKINDIRITEDKYNRIVESLKEKRYKRRYLCSNNDFSFIVDINNFNGFIK